MLAFARKQELKPEPVCLHELVIGMADLLTRSIGPQIRIQTHHAFGTSKAMVDSNQLEMAILNLAVNARDAMPDGGTLTISSDEVSIAPGGPLPPGQYARLQVADSGTGMDSETLRRATEPFFTTKGTGKGTGLGLSMVHGLAAQSGGHFELRSEPGRGAVAEILLPLSSLADGAASAAAAGPIVAKMSGRPLTVLAVDDDPLVLMGLVLVLQDQGHEAIEAYSGKEAPEAAREGRGGGCRDHRPGDARHDRRPTDGRDQIPLAEGARDPRHRLWGIAGGRSAVAPAAQAVQPRGARRRAGRRHGGGGFVEPLTGLTPFTGRCRLSREIRGFP